MLVRRLLVVVVPVLLAACSASSGAARPVTPGASSKPAPVLVLPLATSLSESGGEWAAVAMGHLGQPDNTFWELFFRPAGGGAWRLVTPPGVADNGGLVVASDEAGRVVVGFETSQLLGFSPLASSADDGASWQAGVLPVPLARTPSAFALSPRGPAVALAPAGSGTVETSAAGLSRWTVLGSAATIAASVAGRSCGLTAVTAVGLSATGAPLVGAACSSQGDVGVFALEPGRAARRHSRRAPARWSLIGPRLATRAGVTGTEVVSLVRSRAGIAALVAVAYGGRTELVEVHELGETNRWTVSAPLSVPAGGRVASAGSTAAGGMFVLMARGSRESIDVTTPSGRGWRPLPTPPRGTSVVAFGPGGSDDAIVISGSRFVDYRLAPGHRQWSRAQLLAVPILYGSSS